MKLSQTIVKAIQDPESFLKSRQFMTSCNKYNLDKYGVFDFPKFEEHTREPSDAMILGLWFEYYLIGASRSGEPEYELPTLKSGKLRANSKTMINCVEFAKDQIKKLGIKSLSVQPEWNTKLLTGHPDWLVNWNGQDWIIDIKYTTNERGKYPDYFNNKSHDWYEGLKIQAAHYATMALAKTGELMPFAFLIFRGLGQDDFDVELKTFNWELDHYMEFLKKYIEEVKPLAEKVVNKDKTLIKTAPSFSNCKNCPIKCKDRLEVVRPEPFLL